MKPRVERAPKPTGPITKADIEAKLREVSGELDERSEQGRRFAPVAARAPAAVIVVVYRLGLRPGRAPLDAARDPAHPAAADAAPDITRAKITQGG